MQNSKKQRIIELFIGPNGTHKTELLENIYENLKKENNVLFIRAENKWTDELELKTKTTLEDFRKFLENFFSYELEYKEMSENEKTNIENRKATLKEEISRIFEKENEDLTKEMKNIIKIESNYPKNNKIFPVILKKFQKAEFKHVMGGTGQKFYTFLNLVLIFCQVAETNNIGKTYLIIDEPEKFCHPNLIVEIAYLLKEIAKKINIYIVTHSPTFLNNFIDEKNRKNIELFQFFKKKKLEETLMQYQKNTQFCRKIELSIMNGKIELLNYPVFSLNAYTSLFSEKIILVEGIADQMIVEMIIKKIDINERYKNFFIFNTFGKIGMKACAEWLKNNKINDFFVMFDLDKNKNKEKKANESLNEKILKLIDNKNNCFYFENNLESDLEIEKNSKSFPEWIFNEDGIKKIEKNKKYIELEEKIINFIRKTKNVF